MEMMKASQWELLSAETERWVRGRVGFCRPDPTSHLPAETRGGSVGLRSSLQKSVLQHSMVLLGRALGESCRPIREQNRKDEGSRWGRLQDGHFLSGCHGDGPTLHWKWEPSYFMQPEASWISPLSSSSMMAKHWPLVLNAQRPAVSQGFTPEPEPEPGPEQNQRRTRTRTRGSSELKALQSFLQLSDPHVLVLV